MTTQSSILAGESSWTEEATVHGVSESDTTERPAQRSTQRVNE